MGFCDSPEKPTQTVYRYVPFSVVLYVIKRRGGMVSGELPPRAKVKKAKKG
jgi:hypothetical protein